MDILATNFSNNIKRLRKSKNLTQKQLAETLSYSEKSIAKWEYGEVLPSIDTLVYIGEIFDCTVDYLLTAHETYYLGIDGGGSETKYSLMDSNNNIIKRYVCSCCNPIDLGWEKSINVIIGGIKEICKNIDYSSIVLFAGISGFATCIDKDKMLKEIAKLNFKAYYFKSDVDNACETGLGDKDGIVAIMGTGIIVVKKYNGNTRYYSGYGYLIDEGGSGYNFGLDAVRAYFSELDERGKKTVITSLIEEKSGTSGRDLCQKIYEGSKRYIASFSRLVFEAYSRGDEVANGIINKNVDAVCNVIMCVAKQFDKQVKIAFTGGLTTAKEYMDRIYKKLNSLGYGNLSIIDCPLSDGAAKIAKRLYSEKEKIK